MDSDSSCTERTRHIECTVSADTAQRFEHNRKGNNIGDVDSSVPLGRSYDVDIKTLPDVGLNSNEDFITDSLLLTRSQFIDGVASDVLRNLASEKGMLLKSAKPCSSSIAEGRSVFVDSHLFWKPIDVAEDGNVAICRKERKRWARPVATAADYAQENLEKCLAKDVRLAEERLVLRNFADLNIDRQSFGLNVTDGSGGHRVRNLEVSDTHVFPHRAQENDGRNVSLSDNVPPAASPSSVSSVTSSRRLEWDSGADVGYATQGLAAENRVELSTIERIALARGCSAVLCSRAEPDRTPASGKPSVSVQDSRVRGNKPVAHSTPVEQTNEQIEQTSSAVETNSESEISPILRPSAVSSDSGVVYGQIQLRMAELLQRSKDLCLPSNTPGNASVDRATLSAVLGAKHSNSLTDLPKCEGSKPAEKHTNSLPRNHGKVVCPSKERQSADSINKNHHHSASSSSVATVVYQQKSLAVNPVRATESKPASRSEDCGVKSNYTTNTFNVNEKLHKCSCEMQQQSDDKLRNEPLDALESIVKLSATENGNEACATEVPAAVDKYEKERCPQSCLPAGAERVVDGRTADVVVGRPGAAEEPCGTTGSMASSVWTTDTPQGAWQGSAALVGSANSFEYLPGHAYDDRAGRSAADGKLRDSSLSDGDVERSVRMLQDVTAGMQDVGQREVLLDGVAKVLLGLPEQLQHGTAARRQEADSSEVSSTVFKPHYTAVAVDRNMRRVGPGSPAKGSAPSDSTVDTSSSLRVGGQRDWRVPVTRSERAFEQRRARVKHADVDAASRNHFALLEFCDSERASQLSWIQMEIEHLNSLKHLLRGQEAACLPGKVATIADPHEKPAVPACTLMKITRNTLQASRSETSTTECERSISVTHDGRSIREFECRTGVRQIVSRRPGAHTSRGSLEQGQSGEKDFWGRRDAHTQTPSVVTPGSECDAIVRTDCVHRGRAELSACNHENVLEQNNVTCSQCGQVAALGCCFPKYAASEHSCLTSERHSDKLNDVGMQVLSSQSFTGRSDGASGYEFSQRDDKRLCDVCTQVSSNQESTRRTDNASGYKTSLRDGGRLHDVCNQESTRRTDNASGYETSLRDGGRLHNICNQESTRRSDNASGYKTSLRDDKRLHDVCTQVPSNQYNTRRSDNASGYKTSRRDDERLNDVCMQVPSNQDSTRISDNASGYKTSRRDDKRLRDVCTQVPSNQDSTRKSDNASGYKTSRRDDERLHDVCTQVPSNQDSTRRSDNASGYKTSLKDDKRLRDACAQVPSIQCIAGRSGGTCFYKTSRRDDSKLPSISTQDPSAGDIAGVSQKSFSELRSKRLHTRRSKVVSTQTDILKDNITPTNSGTLEGISGKIFDSNQVSDTNISSGNHNAHPRKTEFSKEPGSSRDKVNKPMCCCECRRALRQLLSANKFSKTEDLKQSKVSSDKNVVPKCRVCGMWLNECAENRTKAFLRGTVNDPVAQTPSFGALPLIQPGWVGQGRSDAKHGERCPCCFSVEDDSAGPTGVETSARRSFSCWKPGGAAANETSAVDRVRRAEEYDTQHEISPRAAETRSEGGDLPPAVGYVLVLESSQSMDSGVQLEEPRRKSLTEVKVKVPSRKRAAREKAKSCLDAGAKRPERKHHGGTHAKENTYGKKPTLQEWLARNRPDFVATAEQRRSCLRELAELRDAQCRSRQRALASGASSSRVSSSVNTDVVPPPLAVKRIFDQRSMRRLTERKYQRLPEVQNKKTEKKRKEDYRTNRLMAEIFTRKLQTKVLKGEVNLSNSVSVISNY